ncbi:MAG: hypothetical protein KDI62_26250 [Anaerolineae bacterium]|nr:hypothetical protein [Anaerolineae bacterium]
MPEAGRGIVPLLALAMVGLVPQRLDPRPQRRDFGAVGTHQVGGHLASGLICDARPVEVVGNRAGAGPARLAAGPAAGPESTPACRHLANYNNVTVGPGRSHGVGTVTMLQWVYFRRSEPA